MYRVRRLQRVLRASQYEFGTERVIGLPSRHDFVRIQTRIDNKLLWIRRQRVAQPAHVIFGPAPLGADQHQSRFALQSRDVVRPSTIFPYPKETKNQNGETQ